MKRLLPFLLVFILFCGCIWAQGEDDLARRVALRQLVQHAEAGNAKALFDLARLHEIGYDSILIDSTRSKALYILSAEQGFAPAMNYIGFQYYKGESFPRDLDSALYWIRKAGDEGDATAAANLGYLLTESKDIPYDEEEALKWLTIASEAGVPEAQKKMVELMKEHWEEWPLDSVLKKGEEYYLSRVPIVGVSLLEIAARNGNARAMALLGDAYSKGVGAVYDHQKSMDYFYEAAVKGDPAAQFIVAELLEIFPDALADSEGAEYWYERAAEGGVTDSDSAYRMLYSIP